MVATAGLADDQTLHWPARSCCRDVREERRHLPLAATSSPTRAGPLDAPAMTLRSSGVETAPWRVDAQPGRADLLAGHIPGGDVVARHRVSVRS